MRSGLTLGDAARMLEAEFEGSGPGLTAVLARYDGECTAVRFADVRDDASKESGEAPARIGGAVPLLRDPSWDLSPPCYRERVRAVRERIAAGDFYVVNLTARLSGELAAASPAEAFVVLAGRAEADMAALFEGLEGRTPWIASVSPERFVRIRRTEGGARSVEVCPIKGTRPRGATDASDRMSSAGLLADEKERAEHVMVVDMERNDLGVCCVPGSVHVDPLYEVVTTPYCHQLVSTVKGTLASHATVAELLDACFPCGSVTGAPKRAAMRTIEALEATSRAAYCGALLVAVRGEIDSSVLIRTLEGDAAGPRATWGSGAGITHESDPASEYLEMLLKASPVLGDGAPGIALRESMRVEGGRIPLLSRHLARLAAGQCGPSVLARVQSEVALALADAACDSACRLSVTVTPDGSVVAGTSTEPSTLSVRGGVRHTLVDVDHAPGLPPAAAKPAARRYWDRAHRVARARGCDQAVIVDHDRFVIDGSTANVWVVRDGTLVTPPAPPAVAGVAREVVFDVARVLGIDVAVRPLPAAELESADEVFFTNAYGGVAAARDRGGDLTARIACAFEESLRNSA
jgi:para-aminobenzoate synthetase/4-amino-4-deoxychorismate lyase